MRNFLRYFVVILVMLSLTTQAEAAQTLIRAVYTENGNADGSYLSTPTKVYTLGGWVNKFTVDNYTYYPEEIYLPNERHPENYRIHSNYTKNTDACASCHSTHTAVGGSLLQWYTNYDTCMACHDGTVATTYNVELGLLPNGQLAGGGAFGTGKEEYSSYHNVTGGVLIESAPGNDTSKGNRNDKPLGCESCHSPHGMGGNARLLTPDPNGVQAVQADNFINYPLTEIEDFSVGTITYVAYPKDTEGFADISKDPYYMLKGYPYKVVIKVDGIINTEFLVDNKAGYSKIVFQNFINGIVTADFIPSLRVRMNITNYLGYGGNEEIRYRDGTIQFCSACHDSYQRERTVSLEAYRHPVNTKIFESSVKDSIYTDSLLWTSYLQYKFETDFSMTCLTCHVAHGTSSEFWQESLNFTPEVTKENAGSSALKRMPNSDLCEFCHNKQSMNEGYQANTNQPHNEQKYATQDVKFTQSFGLSYYAGSNATSCSNGNGVSCHSHIVANWQNTLHSKSLMDNSGLAIDAIELLANTGLEVDDVVYVIGSKWKQRFVYLDGTILKVHPKEYIISNRNWILKNESDFINECIGCHATGFNQETNIWSDSSVACEACHGAAGNHKDVPSSRNITNPRYLNIRDQIDVCAQCHTFGYNKADSKPYPIGYMPYAEGLRSSVYRSSYILENYFTAYTVADYPGNFYNNINSPSTTKDSVYSPQMYNDFVQSKHYQSGAVSCITCHSSHKPNDRGQMLKVTLEQTCGSCHGSSFDLNIVMPKRIKFTNNEADNLRVHTFVKQHDETNENIGDYKLIH